MLKIDIVHDVCCPLADRITCIKCNMKGHFSMHCRNKSPYHSEPTYLEDLIPYHLLKMYKIKTHTPIDHSKKEFSEPTKKVKTMIVKNTKEEIEKTIKDLGLVCLENDDKNIHLLCEFAKALGMKIRFVSYDI